MSTTTTDPISDMFTRMRNAIAVNKAEISLPHSNIKEAVARLLQENNFVDGVEVNKEPIGKMMTVRLNPDGSNARITEIVRLSKPGRRHYASAQDIPVIKRGRGLVIMSTSKGLMTGDQARQQKVGGELICKVY
jgi:small subunit ribosomal protein S8